MTHKSQTRLQKLEDRMHLDPRKHEELRDLIFRVNVNKVSFAVLMEFLLTCLAAMIDPDSQHDEPAFVAEELYQPVSEEELREVRENPETEISQSDDELTRSIFLLLDNYAKLLREARTSGDPYIPLGFVHPNWDWRSFLNRFERLKSKYNQLTDRGLNKL
jgi:hypothetical protein